MGDLYQPPVMNTVTPVTAATLAPGIQQSGTTFVLDRATGIAVTLPAIDSGEIGVKYRFHVKTTVSSGAITIKVPTSAETMVGKAYVISDNSAAVLGYVAGATADTINLDGSTQGGIKGDWIEVEALSTTVWRVNVLTSATGAEATPFAATVS